MDGYTGEKLKEELALIDSAKEYIALLQNILLNESVSLPTIIPEKGQLENFNRAELIGVATRLEGAVSLLTDHLETARNALEEVTQ